MRQFSRVFAIYSVLSFSSENPACSNAFRDALFSDLISAVRAKTPLSRIRFFSAISVSVPIPSPRRRGAMLIMTSTTVSFSKQDIFARSKRTNPAGSPLSKTKTGGKSAFSKYPALYSSQNESHVLGKATYDAAIVFGSLRQPKAICASRRLF